MARGKVRDIYDLGDRLLIVATDRLSAFDVVLPTPIPDKGRVLTQLSLFWFDKLADVVPHHVIAAKDFRESSLLMPPRSMAAPCSSAAPNLSPSNASCAATFPVPAGRIIRRQARSAASLFQLACANPTGLPEPIFTPSTKATTGHDENISFEETVARIGRPLAERLRDREFGRFTSAPPSMPLSAASSLPTRNLNLDCSGRRTDLDRRGAHAGFVTLLARQIEYSPGKAQPSFDKQYVRDYLEQIGWNKQPPAPALPADVVAATSRSIGKHTNVSPATHSTEARLR